DQVHEHLLQLDSISYDPRQLCFGLNFDQYSVVLQIFAHQGKGFPNEVVDVERGSDRGAFLKFARMLSITAPARWPSAAIWLNCAFALSRSGFERSSQRKAVSARVIMAYSGCLTS